MKQLLLLIGFLLLAPGLSAQRVVRQVHYSLTGSDKPPSVSSSLQNSAIGFVGALNEVLVSTSDARGLSWSTAVAIDSDTTGAIKRIQPDSVSIIGDAIYVAWRDARHGVYFDEVYFCYSNDGGVSWAGDVRLDKGYAIGVGDVKDWRMACSGANIFVLISVDPGGANEEIFLVSSKDGGATFGPASPVSSLGLGVEDVDDIALAAEGSTVYVAWEGNRNGSTGDDVFFQRSTDGGVSWQAADTQLDQGPGTGDANSYGSLKIVSRAGRVAVAWLEEFSSTLNEEVRLAVSDNYGVSFSPDSRIGLYSPDTDDVDNMDLFLGAEDELSLVWEDNRSGVDEIFLHCRNQERQLSTAGGGFPHFGRSGGDGNQMDGNIGVLWETPYPSSVEAVYSWNGGWDWTAPMTVSDNSGDADYACTAYNSAYNNWITTWLSDDLGNNGVWVGGFRSATLAVNGVISPGSIVSFDLAHFGTSTEAGVLISGGEGAFQLPFGDGRNIGLLSDSILTTSMANIPGLLSARLGSLGEGTTPAFVWPSLLPVGTSLFLVGVGYSTGSGLELGSLTDIVATSVQ